MCIAIIKDAGIKMPAKETLERCFLNNPHGAGYAIATGNAIKIRKGFMVFNDFWSAIQREGDLKRYVVFMHFRIATHGKKDAGNTHPFPVTDNFEEMRILSYSTTKDVLMHNGVIPIAILDKRYSDTMHFVAMITNMDYWNDPAVRDWISLIQYSSRLAIMNKHGDLICCGDWITDEGVMYSNDSYQPPQIRFLYPWCESHLTARHKKYRRH